MTKYSKEWYQKNKKRLMEYQKKYRSNPIRRKRYLEDAKRRSKIWYQNNKDRRYQMNKEWWKKEIERREKIAGRKRPENCEICNLKGKVMFDHDHKTGKFRGWICMKCNTVLGKVNDDKNLLQSLILYLDKVE